MRKVASAGLGLVLLIGSACSSPATADRPPEPTVAADQKGQPAPLPSLDGMRVIPSLGVTTARKGQAFTGRGPWYLLVAEVEPDTALEYLDSREGWLWIRLPDGRRAWLPASETHLTDRRDPSIRYEIQSGRWSMSTPVGLRVEVGRRAPGVLRVVVEGPEAQEVLAVGERALLFRAALPAPLEGAFDVNDSGVARVSVTQQGVLVDLEKPARHTVVSRTPTRMEVELRPVLDRLEALPGGWRVVVKGETRPVLRPDEGGLLVEIPAAANQAVIPPGLELEEGQMPAGGLRLRLPAPAGPYVLSQPEPGHYELRWVARGLTGKRIVLDPGHGGEETGAVGVSTGVPEKELNLAVAQRLKPLLEAAGAQVIMTRTGDSRVIDETQAAAQTSYQERTQADLQARSALANREGADLVISIHANGGPAGDGGTEVFWAVPNLNAAQSQRLATLAQEELLAALGLADRGVKQRPFNVIRYSEAPAVLVELGFMTNPAEEALLLNDWGQQRSAEALFRAIERYFSPPG